MSETFHEFVGRRLDAIDARNLRRVRRVIHPLPGGKCLLKGRELWDLSSNDYHGFSHDTCVIQATQQAVEEYGVGARASTLISGWTPAHEMLRQELCSFENVEDVLLCSSGYAACQGVIAALVEPDDVLFCDRLNHACLIDGCRLSGAKLRVYRTERLDRLERELDRFQDTPGRRWIITETVFGMDGTVAPIQELVRLAEEYDATLICDEAHATGIYGSIGQGIVSGLREREILNEDLITRRIPVRIGTLSKALGAQGGFVTGSSQTIELLWNTARTLMFSTGLSIAACAGATAAIHRLRQNPARIEHLKYLAKQLRDELCERGWSVLGESDSPIIPVVLGEPDAARHHAKQLEEAGFLVGMVRPPTVPQGTSRLRISLSSIHPEEMLQELVARPFHDRRFHQ